MRTSSMRSVAPCMLLSHACTARLYVLGGLLDTDDHQSPVPSACTREKYSRCPWCTTRTPRIPWRSRCRRPQRTPLRIAQIFRAGRNTGQYASRSKRMVGVAELSAMDACAFRPTLIPNHLHNTCRALPDGPAVPLSSHAFAGSRLAIRLRAWTRRLPMSSTGHITSSLEVCTGLKCWASLSRNRHSRRCCPRVSRRMCIRAAKFTVSSWTTRK